jgi:hypothetical protein
MAGAVTLHTTGTTAAWRLSTFLRSLRRPRGVASIALVAVFPLAIERSVSLFAPDPNSPVVLFAAIGVAAALLLVAGGALITVLRRDRPRAITFADEGIEERTGNRTIARPWGWVQAVIEDDRTLTLHCEEPMRSFQLARSPGALILVVDKEGPDGPRLLALLRAHGPRVVRIG